MGFRIEFKNDKTRATEEVEGSDGRMNVSARSDERAYYNSRDEGQSYAGTWQHTSATSGQYSFFLQNTSTTKTIVISEVGVNSTVSSRFKLHFASIVSAVGDTIIPVNLNKDSSNDAACTMLEDNSTTIATITLIGRPIDDIQVGTLGHEELHLEDRVRLGQNDAIVLECDTTAGTLAHGVVFFYFE